MSETMRIMSQADLVKRAESGNPAHRSRSHEPSGSPALRILGIQQEAGNFAVQRMLASDQLQTRFHAADENRGVLASGASVHHHPSMRSSAVIQRKCPLCNDEEMKKNPTMKDLLPLSGRPTKAVGEIADDRGSAKPSPYNGSATIQCDGGGGYEIVYNSYATAQCGTKNCVGIHEGSHITDWQAKWPTGCQGQVRGYLPKGDPPHDNPLMTVAEYKAFLKDSECRAHTADLQCAESLNKIPGCEQIIDDYTELTRKQRKNWCGLSRGAKVLLGLGSGALVGAGIGALVGGGVGAAIGAGVGAIAGLITGAFV